MNFLLFVEGKLLDINVNICSYININTYKAIISFNFAHKVIANVAIIYESIAFWNEEIFYLKNCCIAHFCYNYRVSIFSINILLFILIILNYLLYFFGISNR